jgi:hypothetical protein
MRYVALLSTSGAAKVTSALEGFAALELATTIEDVLLTLTAGQELCLVVDPALLSLSAAGAIIRYSARAQVRTVVFTSVTQSAMEISVLFARQTNAQFVFAGAVNERSLLTRALLLSANVRLGEALLDTIHNYITNLPGHTQEVVRAMFKGGDSPSTPNALARMSAVSRRTLDRQLFCAGFRSARLLVSAAKVVRAYSAITSSTIPFRRIAAVFGHATQRSMDSQLSEFLDRRSAQLRAAPLSHDTVVAALVTKLTTSEYASTYNSQAASVTPASGPHHSSSWFARSPGYNAERVGNDRQFSLVRTHGAEDATRIR